MSEPKKPIKKALSNIGKAFAKFGLPAIGTAIGGPAGAVVAGTIGGILGVDPEKEDAPKAIESALANASPEVLAQIRQIEANIALSLHETERTEIDALTERLRLDTTSQSKLSQNIRPIVTVALLALYALYAVGATTAVMWSFHGAGRADSVITQFLVNIAMINAGLVATVVAFYFGGRAAEIIKHGKPRDRALNLLLGKSEH